MLLKFITAPHVSAYSAIIRCFEIWENCCAFYAAAIAGFIFTVFLNEVKVVPPPVSHVLSFLVCLLSNQVCNVMLYLDIVAWWTVNK
jgi:hypothetical protein